jgi:hypothetical protein
MNPNWTFAWFDLDRKQWQPSAVDPLINQGFFSLDTRQGNHRIFAGHPVIANHPEARIGVTSDAKSYVRASVNNVTDLPMPLTLRLHPALGAPPPVDCVLQPGELKTIDWKLGP